MKWVYEIFEISSLNRLHRCEVGVRKLLKEKHSELYFLEFSFSFFHS